MDIGKQRRVIEVEPEPLRRQPEPQRTAPAEPPAIQPEPDRHPEPARD